MSSEITIRCMGTTTTRYIAKCNACKLVTSALSDGRHETEPSRKPVEPCPKGIVFRHFQTGSLCIACRGCGRAKYAKLVRGVFSAKHVCGAKCMSSTGTTCECSCGGKNHGASHAA
jgi:hypothetical protein